MSSKNQTKNLTIKKREEALKEAEIVAELAPTKRQGKKQKN